MTKKTPVDPSIENPPVDPSIENPPVDPSLENPPPPHVPVALRRISLDNVVYEIGDPLPADVAGDVVSALIEAQAVA